jgi:hypothetical protein
MDYAVLRLTNSIKGGDQEEEKARGFRFLKRMRLMILEN